MQFIMSIAGTGPLKDLLNPDNYYYIYDQALLVNLFLLTAFISP